MVDSVICGRVGCAEPAVSVLLIAPQDQQAWLVGPDHEAARDGVRLCASHADRVTVPFGWQLRDDRPVAKPRARRKSRSRKATPEPLLEAPTETGPAAEIATRRATPTRRSAETERAAQPEPAQPVADAEPAPAAPAPAGPVEPAVVAPAAAEAETPTPAEPEVALDIVETDQVPVDAATADEVDAVDDLATADEVDGADTPPDAAATEAASDAEWAKPNRPHSPADVPVLADDVAAAVAGSGARLTVVPGDDDPSKTFAVEPDGQTALWVESQRDDHEPSDETPLLKRAFRVVRED